MGNKILITAKPRTGKSTLIKKIISEVGYDKCGGFYTEEIRKDGERIGFMIKSLDGNQGILASVDTESDIRVSRYGVDIATFESICLPSIKTALRDKEIIIIDEIGPMQMYSEKYKNLLLEILTSNKILIGTIFYDSYDWIDDFKKNKELELIELTFQNRDSISKDIIEKALKDINMEDKEMIRKIRKANKYCNETERFKITNFTVEIKSEHDTRTINYNNESGCSCTCDFYKERGTCSHIMAIEKILGPTDLIKP